MKFCSCKSVVKPSAFVLSLPARWQSLLTQDRGGICDLSASGCFLLTAGEVKAGELVRLEIDLGSHLVFAWEKVAYRVAEMGFALRFVFSEENERRALTKLIEKLQEGHAVSE